MNKIKTTLEWISTEQALPQIPDSNGSFYRRSVDVLISWEPNKWVKGKYVSRRVRGSKNTVHRFEWKRRQCPFKVLYWAIPQSPNYTINDNEQSK